MVKELWAEVKGMLREHLHVEVAECVLNPENTTGRASSYDHMLMTYWVTMCLVGHSSAMQESKREGDTEVVPF